MKQKFAETVALQGLAWLAGEADLLGVFLGASGLAEADLRERAGDPDLLAALLDFLLMDDAWVRRFCEDAGLPPDTVMRARAVLPGGAQVHWT